ncbi:mitochondrial sodium/calcium exchanger protein-like [Schistocerca piceifrons]|uniref:mitochondrial sodium/calcium exchanger protein-like n=1 Tax=Schistocerca piceifrons TaxID=274613 RepID=UPI001F5F499D|nr:mitochondrial sodium/calcium exchanger protein-like [Schistocerca piceifrons]
MALHMLRHNDKMFLMMFVTFVVLSTTADCFFCPALAAIATWLGLSESVAGVTVLAFGNGSPDIFTSIAAAPSGRVGMILAELLGGGIFVTTVTAGFVLLCTPFKMYGTSFLRDGIFYLMAVLWLYIIFLDGHLTYIETTAMIIIYGVYLAVVLIGNYIEAYKLKKEQIRSFMEKVGNNQSSRRSTRHTLPPPTRQRKQSISTLMVHSEEELLRGPVHHGM